MENDAGPNFFIIGIVRPHGLEPSQRILHARIRFLIPACSCHIDEPCPNEREEAGEEKS
jgi:hypothetical protein